MTNATVAPDRVLKELSDLWVSLGKQGQTENDAGVLRACTMTLVVLAEAGDDFNALGETIAALMPEHPSRAVLIRLSGEGERALSSRVYAQCWMPFGQRRQICCEQVELTASDAALGDLPSVVLPLAAPDLPLIVWCRSARLPGMAEFREIAAMADKVVLDSAVQPDAGAALHRMAAAAARGIVLGDLSWTRLTRWRATLSQVFENRDYVAQLPRLTDVRVTFGGSYAVAAWYTGAWVTGVLAAAGVQPQLAVTPQAGENMLRLELAGEGLRVELERKKDRLVVTVNSLSQCTHLPQPTDYLLMREELSVAGKDRIYEQALALAARLAYPTKG